MASAEDVEQIKIVEWVKQLAKVPVLHIANQRQTSPQHGTLLKRMGVRPGTSDLFFPRGSGRFSGLWIELKVGNNKPSSLQQQFLDEMNEEGYLAECVWGSESAIQLIKSFYGLK